ncbi:MAG: hypothetical protein NTW94_10000 [Legionellales bacterium]|nr:hypothetical protein [Legionellales bacterium]
MKNNSKTLIYKAMIHYLLDSTRYTFKDIADLSDTSINNIRSIYYDDQLPAGFSSELQLVKLYHMVIELENHTPRTPMHSAKE